MTSSLSVVGGEVESDVGESVCVRCEVRSVRQLEREAVDGEYRCPRFSEYQLAMWSARTVVSGEFVGLGASELDGAREFRGAMVRRNLRAKPVPCRCAEVDSVHLDWMSLIKPHARESVYRLFGDNLTVGQLLLLPVGSVEWSELASFRLETSDDTRMRCIIRGTGGVSLSAYLLGARPEVHGHPGEWFRASWEQLFARFSCAELFLPRYRSVAMSYLGSFPDMLDVWKVTTVWMDWQAVCSAQLSVVSTVAAWRATEFREGMDFSQASVQLLSDQLVRMPVGSESRPVHRPVPAGGTLCLQLVREVDECKLETGSYEDCVVAHHAGVLLTPGLKRFHSRDKVVMTFPVGCWVKVAGVCYGSPGVEVAVCFSGLLACEVGLRVSSAHDPPLMAMVSCESSVVYAGFRSDLDSHSVTARFLARTADVAVVKWPDQKTWDGACHRFPEWVSLAPEECDFEGDAIVEMGAKFSADQGKHWIVSPLGEYCVISQLAGREAVVLNDCVRLEGTHGCVGVAGLVECGDAVGWLADQPWRLRVYRQGDSHELNEGGLSPGDSDYGSEFSIEDRSWYGETYRGKHLCDMSRDELARVPGYCYVNLYGVEFFRRVAASLHSGPTLAEVMGVEDGFFRRDYRSEVGMIVTDWGWHVAELPAVRKFVPWSVIDSLMVTGDPRGAVARVGFEPAVQQLERNVRLSGYTGDFSQEFVRQAGIVCASAAFLGSDDKDRLRMLQACGDAFLSLEVASSVLSDGGTAQEYQEQRARVTASSRLTESFLRRFDGDGFQVPAGVNVGSGRLGGDFVKATLGLVYAELGRDVAVEYMRYVVLV